MGYRIEKRDLEQIENIIKTTQSIETLYKRLYELEINGKKDTKEFKTNYDYLTIALEVEENNYKNANLTAEKIQAWIKYIFETKVPKEFYSDSESVVRQDYSNKTIRRILNILSNKKRSYFEVPEEISNDVFLKNIMKLAGIDNPSELFEEATQATAEMDFAFNKDYTNSILHIIKELLNKKEYANYKNNLIGTKYYLSFLNKTVEEGLLFSEFEIPEMLYFISSNKANVYKLDSTEFKIFKKEYAFEKTIVQILGMLKLSDLDYANEKNAITSILRECFIRAGFMLLDEDTLEDLNYEFHEFLESNDFLEEHKHDKISTQLVINCFKKIKKDKETVNIISLKLKAD